MLILLLTSPLSSGSPLPSNNADVKRELLYYTSKDSYEDAIKPRLERFPNTNFDNNIFINENKYSLTMLGTSNYLRKC